MYNANWNVGIIHTVKHGHQMFIRYGARSRGTAASQEPRRGGGARTKYYNTRNETAMDEKPIETELETYEVRYRAATPGMSGSDRGTAAPQELRRGGGARTVY